MGLLRYFAQIGIPPWDLDRLTWPEFHAITEGKFDDDWQRRPFSGS